MPDPANTTSEGSEGDNPKAAESESPTSDEPASDTVQGQSEAEDLDTARNVARPVFSEEPPPSGPQSKPPRPNRRKPPRPLRDPRDVSEKRPPPSFDTLGSTVEANTEKVESRRFNATDEGWAVAVEAAAESAKKDRRETDTQLESPEALKQSTSVDSSLPEISVDAVSMDSASMDGASMDSASMDSGASMVTSASIETRLDSAPSPPSGGPAKPSRDPDKTEAMASIDDESIPTAPYDSAEDLFATANLERPRYHSERPVPTASTLHEEDEDGITMVAPFPAPNLGAPRRQDLGAPPSRPGPPAADDEATQLHPRRLPLSDAQVMAPIVPSHMPPGSGQLDLRSDDGFSPGPPRSTIPTIPPTAPPRAAAYQSPLSQREAAVQAAIDAAAGLSVEARMLDEGRARAYDTVATAMLGIGMITAALASYLAAGALQKAQSYTGILTLTAISLFLVGIAPLQRRNETKLSFLSLGGVMLVFTIIRLCMIALG